jgi:hypothetical protein
VVALTTETIIHLNIMERNDARYRRTPIPVAGRGTSSQSAN